MSIDARAKSYGKIWGGWTIGKLIGTGSGGKTAVFELTRDNLTFTEHCAMKVINIIDEQVNYNEISDEYREYYNARKEEMRRNAEAEVNLMHQLKDCYNVVQYYDFEFNDWQEENSFGTDLLIRMDYLGNLNAKMKKEGVSQSEIVQIGIDICTALEGCAEHNIIHRDIKPDNIFMNGSRYLLGDFGISKIIENGMGAQTNKGTAHYAAPEQFANATTANYYDNRVDIYSLALTLYVLANKGKLPFTNKVMNVQLAIQMRLTGTKFEEIDGIDPQLMQIILLGCKHNPDERFKTATAFKNALGFVKKHLEEVEAQKANTPEVDELVDDNESYETEEALKAQTGVQTIVLGAEKELISYETEPALEMTPVVSEEEESYETQPALEMTPVVSEEEESYETQPALEMTAVVSEEEESYETQPALEMTPVVEPAALVEPVQVVQSVPIEKSTTVVAQALSYVEIENLKNIAKTKVQQDDRAGALEIFMQLAAAGEMNVMYTEISKIYNSNKIVKNNPEAAIFWYQKCIEMIKDSWTISLAENRLGEIYSNGIGVKKNHELAEQYYRSSASKGNPYAKKKFVSGKYIK